MRTEVPELIFKTRSDFRKWLHENSETSEGVWLIFGKTKAVVTLSSNDALEEALCYGWIDGQMQSIGNTKYLKYFAKRRAKSKWSEKNKKIVAALREKNLMTAFGETAIETAKNNGMWDAPKGDPITEEQVEAFTQMLVGQSPAYENFCNMPKSVRFAYTGRCHSFKTEEGRQKDFQRIIERLHNNLKPM